MRKIQWSKYFGAKLVVVLFAVNLSSCEPAQKRSSSDAYDRPDVHYRRNFLTDTKRYGLRPSDTTENIILGIDESRSTSGIESGDEGSSNLKSRMGNIKYYVPDTMKVGNEYEVKLRIAQKISKEFNEGMSENAVSKQIRISDLMAVVIKETDPEQQAFKIVPLSSDVQTIEQDSSYTAWDWTILPLKSGKHKLKLTVVMKEKDLTKDIPVYEDEIVVVSSPLYSLQKFVNNNWQYLLSTLLLPFIIFIWKKGSEKK